MSEVARNAPVVHLVNPMWDPFGGSERRVRDMHRMLSRVGPATIWGMPGRVSARLAAEVPIFARPGHSPRGGVVVIVGVYFDLDWIRPAAPERVILVVNTSVPTSVVEWRMLQVLGLTGCAVEIVYASISLSELIGLPGVVQPSTLDLGWFTPPSEPRSGEPFVVGRLSRDFSEKHHPDDPALYERLAAAGMRVRVMGGTCLAPRFASSRSSAIELLPAGAEDARDFLRGLDAFFYRTAPSFTDAAGRTVAEAMACGLALVCGRPGGYCDYISHAEDGFLVDSTEEAFSWLQTLREDRARAQTVGAAARRKILGVYADHEQSLADYYFGGNKTAG